MCGGVLGRWGSTEHTENVLDSVSPHFLSEKINKSSLEIMSAGFQSQKLYYSLLITYINALKLKHSFSTSDKKYETQTGQIIYAGYKSKKREDFK